MNTLDAEKGRTLLVVGSVALDTVITPFGEGKDMLGGSAVYFALAASFYVPVQMVGVVGEDFPDSHVELLKSKGVDLEGLQRRKGNTFRWGGEYGYDLNQRDTLFTELNVFETFRPELPDAYRNTPCIFLGNIDPELQSLVLDQVGEPAFVAGDTMNFWIDLNPEKLMEVISRLDVLLLNDSEVRQMSGEPNMIKAARSLLERGARGLIVKKGEHGAMMLLPDECFFAPAYPLELVIDPTGAGDSFAGGFMGYLARCDVIGPSEIRTAVIHGSVVSSFCVEAFGVKRLAELTLEEIEGRAVEFKKMTMFDFHPAKGRRSD